MTKQDFVDLGHPEAVLFDSPDYDSAIVGITTDGCAIYDYDAMVDCLMKKDGMTQEDAEQYIDYNTIRTLLYIPEEHRPVIFHRYKEG